MGPAYGSWTQLVKSHAVARQKSIPTETNETRRNTVKRITKFGWSPSANTTSLLRYSCAINYPVLRPNTAYSSNIQSTSLQYSPFPIAWVPDLRSQYPFPSWEWWERSGILAFVVWFSPFASPTSILHNAMEAQGTTVFLWARHRGCPYVDFPCASLLHLYGR